jgi:hypothetical protein
MAEITAIVRHPDGDYTKPYDELTGSERLVVNGHAKFIRMAGELWLEWNDELLPDDRNVDSRS